MTRSRPNRRAVLLVLLAVSLPLTLSNAVTRAEAAAVQVGFTAQRFGGLSKQLKTSTGKSYTSTASEPTSSKPESKLWYHDGVWWAAMVSTAQGGSHTIHRLSGDAWVDTGELIDARPDSHEDVLAEGSAILIVSRHRVAPHASYLRRFVYTPGSNGVPGSYRIDATYTKEVPGPKNGEAITLARDSTGRLWLAFDSETTMYYAYSSADGSTWSSRIAVPFVPQASYNDPVDSRLDLRDDICAVVPFSDATGPAIGIMWSNQVDQHFYFAVHRDGFLPQSGWTLETALGGTTADLEADDHINVKVYDGRVFTVIKTSKHSAGTDLIKLLERKANGTWTQHPVAKYEQRGTRPITVLQIDEANKDIYVFMSSTSNASQGVTYKKTSLNGIGFPAQSTVFLRGANNEPINDATSLKANATSASGIVVVAHDRTRYWWNRIGGGPTAAP